MAAVKIKVRPGRKTRWTCGKIHFNTTVESSPKTEKTEKKGK